MAGRHAVGERKVGVVHCRGGAGKASARDRRGTGPRAVALAQTRRRTKVARDTGARGSLAGVGKRIIGITDRSSIVSQTSGC